MKIALHSFIAAEMRLPKMSVVSVFSSWFYSQKENPETSKKFNYLKTLNFFSRFSKTLPAYVRTKILTV